VRTTLETVSEPASAVKKSVLVVAGLVVTAQAVALLAFVVLDLTKISAERIGLGVGVAALLFIFGAGLLVAGLAVMRGRRGGRGPALVAQFIALGLAVNLWSAPERVDRVVAIVLAVGAAVVLGCLFSGAGRRAMGSDDAA